MNVIYKTKEIAIELMKQVKKDLKKLTPEEPKVKEERQEKKIDGLNYLDSYIPHMNKNTTINTYPIFMDEYKTIEK